MRPPLDLAAIAVGMAVVVITVAIALMESRLVLTLQLVVEYDAIDPRAAPFQALCFTFERPIDLDVVFEFSLPFNARVEALAGEALEWLYPRPGGRWREHERD